MRPVRKLSTGHQGHVVLPIETALSTLAHGLITWANQFDVLSDVLDARTNADMHRLEDFTNLREACASNSHVVLGSTVTLRRKATRESFCVAVGVSTAPPADGETKLLSWQFGFWCDAVDQKEQLISGVYALPADAGGLVVLEQLRPAAETSLQRFVAGASVNAQAFVSYVREDTPAIDRLCGDLGRQGVATWIDRDKLEPGVRWKDGVRNAIQQGSGFVACFSKAYEARPRTYMNEELNLAIEELRLRPRDRSWFFPVLLEDVQVPAIPIGAGETLRDLQAVSLALGWAAGVSRLARAIRTASQPPLEAIYQVEGNLETSGDQSEG